MAEKKEKKERLDVLLVEQGIAESREKAKRYIMAGMVFIGEKRVDKAGEKVPVSSNIIFRGEKLPFVSRGGFKLDKAVKSFGIDLKGKRCLDIGASIYL